MRSLSKTFTKILNYSKHIFCFWTISFITYSLNAQEQTSNKKKSLQEERKNTIKVTPFKVLDFTNPAIEISYERKTSYRFSSQLMLSKLISANWIYDSGVRDIDGYRLSIEEKFYTDKTALKGEYISIEFNYLKSNYNNSIQFEDSLVPKDEYNYLGYFEDVLVKKKLYNLNIKIGHQFIMDNLVLDGFFGLGLRYRDVAHHNRSNYDDKMMSPRHPNIHYYKNLPGKGFGLSLPLNLRVGYNF